MPEDVATDQYQMSSQGGIDNIDPKPLSLVHENQVATPTTNPYTRLGLEASLYSLAPL